MIKTYKILLLLLFSLSTIIQAQEFKTFTYFTTDSINLDLDLFLPESVESTNFPLVIYVHGGGFSNGSKGGGYNLARHLISKNIACATINYTLYAKYTGFGCDVETSEKIKAIQIAVSELWLATDFLLKRSEKIHIDTSKIFLAGSSAGAETVLHAAFWDKTQMQMFEQKLNPGFKYAGLISGAGAIMDINLITSENKIPLMLFHGDADATVPYGIASHHYCPPGSRGWLMLFGSLPIAYRIQELKGTCELFTFKGRDHSIAGEYIYQRQQPVVDFIHKILSGEKFIIYQTIEKETKKQD